MQYSTTKICRLGLLVYKQLNHKGSGGGEFTHKMALLVTGAVMPGLLLDGGSHADAFSMRDGLLRLEGKRLEGDRLVGADEGVFICVVVDWN